MPPDQVTDAETPPANIAVQVLAQEIPIFGVEVFGQDIPFGGVQVILNDQVTQVDFGNGTGGGGSTNLVTSVFTRVGDVVAQSNDYSFAQIGAKPTTLSGYGITDAERYLGNPSTNGFILSSTTAGARSWIAPPSGGGGSSPWINVMDYGAMADDVTDDTAAFNAAITAAGPLGTVYVPPGTYQIAGEIHMHGSLGRWTSTLQGAGREVSTLHIPASAVSAVTVATIHAALGVTITDLRMVFDQPDQPDYSGSPYAFNHYKPAIMIDLVYRQPTIFTQGARFLRLRIENAWDGIQVIGSANYGMGRDIFEDIEMSMLNYGFHFDGYADSARMDKVHVFPFGMTSNQLLAFFLQGHSVSLYVGRHPDLRVTNSLFINGSGLVTYPSPIDHWLNYGTYAGFVNCGFDSYAILTLGGGSPINGQLAFTQCRFTAHPDVAGSFINIVSGPVLFTGCTFENLGLTALNAPLINNVSSYAVQISNSLFFMQQNDQTAILSTGRMVEVSNCNFYRTPDITYTAPTISVTSGRAIIIGNHCRETTVGAPVFLNLPVDDYHVVSGNEAHGWFITWPASPVKTQAFGNILRSTIGASGQNLVLGIKNLSLEGGSTSNLKLLSGSGSPQGIVTADPGSLYLDTSTSGAGNYLKKTGTGNTGWTAAGQTEVWSGPEAPVPTADYLLWIDTDAPTPGGGPVTGDLNFIYTQVSPSSSWPITHSLGKYPSVSVVDSGGSVIIADVLYPNINQVTVSFGAATSGKAYLN